MEVTVDDLAVAREHGAFLLDVREPEEYAEVRVPGAVLVPLGTLPWRLAEVPADRAVYVICRTGARSMRATMFLRSQGVEAFNVTGGTDSWIRSGRAVEGGDEVAR